MAIPATKIPAAAPVPAVEAADKKPAVKAAKPGKKDKKGVKKFSINCQEPVDDDIFDITSFEKFLRERIKVAGKTGVLGEHVTIARDGFNINVTANITFSKRYLKYLTKKFLKKQMLRDYIRVIARAKNSYHLRYFNFHNEENEETKGRFF